MMQCPGWSGFGTRHDVLGDGDGRGVVGGGVLGGADVWLRLGFEVGRDGAGAGEVARDVCRLDAGVLGCAMAGGVLGAPPPTAGGTGARVARLWVSWCALVRAAGLLALGAGVPAPRGPAAWS